MGHMAQRGEPQLAARLTDFYAWKSTTARVPAIRGGPNE